MRIPFTLIFFYKALAISILFLCFTFEIDAQVSGTVFRDFNANGVKDNTATFNEVGMAGVMVKATDPTGTALTVTYTSGAATTSTGTYNVSGGNLGQIRLEFIMPDTHTFASSGANGGTFVMFPTSTTQDLAVNYPQDYCQSNPELAVSRYVGGALNGTGAAEPAFIRFGNTGNDKYIGQSGYMSPTTITDHQHLGAVYGNAYSRISKKIYTGAVLRRHITFGPLGIGGLYEIDPTTNVVNNWLDIETLAGIDAGTDTRNNSDPANTIVPVKNYDAAAFALIGKQSLGDIEISDDGKTLYVVNLFQQSLVAIDVASKTLIGSYPISASALGLTCPQSDFRPWGLKYYKGKLYVGAVCTAETSQLSTDMNAYVLSFDPNNIGSGFSIYYSFSLNYSREQDPWHPWNLISYDPGNNSGPSTNQRNSQAILSNIEFDVDGSLILGLMDRHGMMFSSSNNSPDATATANNSVTPFSNGDILRVCNTNSGLILEGGAGCGYNPPAAGGTAIEFYDDRRAGLGNGNIKEVAGGALAFLPGYNEITSTAIDEYNVNENGICWWNNTNGIRNRAYMVFDKNALNAQGKTAGLGDIELLCNAAPIEIGNRVFMDTDADGEQDADEMGLDGIKVELWKVGSKVTETTTANGGQWYFTNVDAETDYEVKILASSFPSGKSITTSNTSGNAKDLIDSDAALVGADAVITYKTGSAGQNNHSLDFGFKTAQICNLTASATGTNVKCNAGTDGTATAAPTGNTGAVTYVWSNGATTASITTLAAGTYTVTVTESANCTATASYTVTEPSDITLACAKTDVTTTGGNNGTATVTATGGTSPYAYVWSNGATTDAITGLTAGTFTVTVTDANGCSDICSSQINEPGCNLTASATGTNVSCNAGTNGTATATPSGNLSPVTYVWSNGATTASITTLTAGTYNVTVTESANCTATSSYTVTEPSDITLACAKTDVTTTGGNNGTATVTASGGTSPYTYLWSNGATTASITGLTAGTYTVTVTDASGCSDVCSSQVNEPGCNLTASATGTNISCNAGTDGTATVTPSGNLSPVTYVWSNGAATASITALAAGTYNVTVTESANCTATASYSVTEPSDITLACAKTDVTTNGGSNGTATVTATGGTSPYNYLWSNGATTASIISLTAGNYTVTVTDANGCSDICDSQVNEPGCNLTASATGTNVSCNAGTNGTTTVTPSGNLSPVTYVWSNGATTASLTTLAAGTYNVTVTESANCTTTASYTVTEPSDITLACAKTDVTTTGGNNGTATVTATGGTSPYTYLWSNGATTASITGLTAGTYTVTVTDANGCSDMCSSTIVEPGCTQPTVGTNTPSAGTCNGAIANDDAQIVFTGFTNADKADKVSGATYNGVAYNAATLTLTAGAITVTGLKHNTQYTFRFWNGADNCYIDVSVTTPSKSCTTPCPSPSCGSISVKKL